MRKLHDTAKAKLQNMKSKFRYLANSLFTPLHEDIISYLTK